MLNIYVNTDRNVADLIPYRHGQPGNRRVKTYTKLYTGTLLTLSFSHPLYTQQYWLYGPLCGSLIHYPLELQSQFMQVLL